MLALLLCVPTLQRGTAQRSPVRREDGGANPKSKIQNPKSQPPVPLLIAQAQNNPTDAPPPPHVPPFGGQGDLLDLLNDRLAEIVNAAHDSVVSIKGHLKRPLPEGHLPGFPLPPSGNGLAVQLPVTGSGFLLPGGIVVTTAEVVVGLSTPSVVLADGRTVRATAIGYDERTNVALLRIKLPHPEIGLHWGDSSKVRAGHLAVTIGNLFGFTNSASFGMISTPDQKAVSTNGGRHYEGLIQFQGALSGGGSGSPLFNLHGEVTGMVIGIIDPATNGAHVPSGGATMGFALPAAAIQKQMGNILQNMKPLPTAGWIGIRVRNRPGNGDVMVTRIYQGSPADVAGVQLGDVVSEIDDEPIRSETDLTRVADQLCAGQKLRVELRRGDRSFILQIEITPKPDDPTQLKTRSLPPRVGVMPDGILFVHPMG
jgi:S1-C subfamily serine protease